MTVFVNAIMYYKVANAIHAVANVDDYSGSARLLAATTLRYSAGSIRGLKLIILASDWLNTGL